jgi:hypothetical protein
LINGRYNNRAEICIAAASIINLQLITYQP